MSIERDELGPTPLSSAEERTLLARYALALIQWRWFPGCAVVRKRDEQLLIPPLLFGLYLAQRRDKKITKGEACDFMRVDRATTGPKFIRALEGAGLVKVERYPEIDKRKDFLAPTPKLEKLVERELRRLALHLTGFANDLTNLGLMKGIDLEDATRVPSGGPSLDGMFPVDWPPDDVGTVFDPSSQHEEPE